MSQTIGDSVSSKFAERYFKFIDPLEFYTMLWVINKIVLGIHF